MVVADALFMFYHCVPSRRNPRSRAGTGHPVRPCLCAAPDRICGFREMEDDRAAGNEPYPRMHQIQTEILTVVWR